MQQIFVESAGILVLSQQVYRFFYRCGSYGPIVTFNYYGVIFGQTDKYMEICTVSMDVCY